MPVTTINIRLMEAADFDAVVAIDERVLNVRRQEYYQIKFEKLMDSKGYLPVSLIAETQDGTPVGFVMGEVYLGQYGIFQERAMLDTIGVDPAYRHQGIGEQLISEFVDHLKQLGVEKVYTLVTLNDSELIRFFSTNSFVPSSTLNLERSL